jgi:hypothetical protein
VVSAAFLFALDMEDFFPEVALFVSDDFFAFCSLVAGSACCSMSSIGLGLLSSKGTFFEIDTGVFLLVET